MSILDQLKKLGGCAGGVAIYRAAKDACRIANITARKRRLKPETIAKFSQLFPRLDLDRVRICINCTLPANWYPRKKPILGITFGYTIYFKNSNIQKTDSGLNLLMHELVHVDQVRRFGDSESVFACKYGEGFLAGGSYEANPLEKEAYDFSKNHSIPDLGVVALLDWWEDKDFKGRHHRRKLCSIQHGQCLRLVNNDAMKSLKLTAYPGWKLELYDNSEGKKSDDWAVVTFPNDPNVKVVEVPKIGRHGESEVHPKGCYKLHYKNGLAGKVSSIRHTG